MDSQQLPPDAAAMHHSLHAKLLEHRLNDVLAFRSSKQDRRVLTLEHNASMSDALRVSASEALRASNLDNFSGGAFLEQENTMIPVLVGWADIKDVVSAFLEHLHEHHPELPTSMLSLMTLLDKESHSFVTRMIITLHSSEDRGLVYKANANTTLLETIRDQFLSVRSNGRVVHRLAVFDSHGQILDIISQMDVIRFLASAETLDVFESRTVEQLGLVAPSQGGVVTVQPQVPTLLAFESMMKAGVSGAPVMDGPTMIANISISDLKRIQPEHLSVLALPVAEFLALSHNTSYLGYSASSSGAPRHPFFADVEAPTQATANPKASPAAHNSRHNMSRNVTKITCSADTTLKKVVNDMVQFNIHRMYVVQPGATPCEVIAVITPTDIMELLIAA